jgi:hypothetical protein
MSITAFFEKFMGLQQQKVQATVASYREFVAGIATGEEPDPAEVERLLASAGKSMEEKAWSEHQRAERELTLGDTEARREVAERYRKEGESARRDAKRLEKARADLDKRCDQLEQRMRQA